MISFAAEPIAHIGSFSVTNTFLHTLFVDGLIIGGIVYLKKNLSVIPNKFQNAIELVMQTLYSLTESVAAQRAANIFPFFASFFLFIVIANLTNLLPGIGTIGIFEHEKLIPLLRGTTSDINTTLGLALVSAAATHVLSIKTIGIKSYLSRFFSFNPINLFIGVLEIISEITKVVSLSFRLFGNIFAGEVVITKISSIFAFIIPLPFLLLEVIVGFVQALVFSMLTMAFMAILTTPPSHGGHEGGEH